MCVFSHTKNILKTLKRVFCLRDKIHFGRSEPLYMDFWLYDVDCRAHDSEHLLQQNPIVAFDRLPSCSPRPLYPHQQHIAFSLSLSFSLRFPASPAAGGHSAFVRCNTISASWSAPRLRRADAIQVPPTNLVLFDGINKTQNWIHFSEQVKFG